MPAVWTTPRTWTAGELVTAAIGNSAWRDNLLYLKDSPTFDQNVTVTGTTLLTGVATFTAAPVFSAATASQAVFTNGSKALVSNAITGTGNVVMSASPTLTGTIAGAAMTLSSTLGVTGATTLSSTVATGALTVTGAATVSTTLGVTGATTLSSATYSTFLKSTTALATPAALTATQATAFASTVSGSAIMGFGTTNDVSLMNRAGTVVLGIGPNTTTVNIPGTLTVSGAGSVFSSNVSDTSARYAIFGNSTNITYIGVDSSTAASFGTGNNATALASFSSPGISISSQHASSTIRFYSGGTTENMRIHANGRVTIGAATVIASARQTVAFLSTDNGMTIENQDNQSGGSFMIFTSAQTINGVISRVAATAAVTYGTTSDQRLKTDRGLASNIARLRALPIHDFDWKSDGTTDRGVFAQEAYSLYPLAVTKGTDELNDNGQLSKPWSVSYASFVPDLIVGWQQQDKEITQLAARIAALETKDN